MSTISASKLNIISAASRVTQRVGAANLTLERVAAAAGISKGGLLYHYANKRALLEGMLGHLLSLIETRLSQAPENRSTADYILLDATPNADERAISQVLLAAAAEDPELMDPARQLLERQLRDAQAHSKHAPLILLAAEGLRFLDVMNLLPDDVMRKKLFHTIATAAQELD